MPTLTDSYAQFGAIPHNIQWSCSAIAENNDVVLSCWKTPDNKKWGSCQMETLKESGNLFYRYTDNISEWNHKSKLGDNEVLRNVQLAYEEGRDVRLVLISAAKEDMKKYEHAGDMKRMKKKFHPVPRLVGKIMEFDGSKYVVEFRADRTIL